MYCIPFLNFLHQMIDSIIKYLFLNNWFSIVFVNCTTINYLVFSSYFMHLILNSFSSLQCWVNSNSFILSVAPLCFLYHEPSKLYQIFREMYVRFFFRLHSISSHPSVSSLGIKTHSLDILFAMEQ